MPYLLLCGTKNCFHHILLHQYSMRINNYHNYCVVLLFHMVLTIIKNTT